MPEEERGPIGRFIDRITGNYRKKTTPEPLMPLWKAGIQEPVLVQGVSIPALYATVQESVILRTTINTLCQEIFRRGHYWKRKFHKKCLDCEEEYKHDVDSCKVCDSDELKTPDPDQIMYPRWLLKRRNGMDQSFMDVLREAEWDLNIVDDTFLILVKEYYIDRKEGKIEFFRVKEILRGDPTFMRIVADKRGVRGGRYLICPVHRDKTHPFKEEEDRCDICNLALQDVHFINTAGSGKTQYYINGEVVHVSKFNPSKLYGRSPVATMWRQAMTLTAMDNYMYLAYQKRRIPRGVLSITTDNIQSTAAFWKGAEEKMERDPNYIPKVGVESATGRGRVEFVRFMDTLDEMQYGAVRDELRMRIAAFYGVSNIFMMDSGKGGGLNNEGLQILVTNRAVEFGQKLWKRDIFPRIFDEMGMTDWELTLYPNEEEDDVTRLRRDEMEVNIAQRMQQLGFQPELTEDAGRDIRFVYRKPEHEEMMGGQPGGGQPMGGQPGGGAPPMQMPPPGMGGAGVLPGAPPPASARPVPAGGVMATPAGGLPGPAGAGPGPAPAPAVSPYDKGVPIRRSEGPTKVSTDTQLSGAPKPKKHQRGTEDSPEEKAAKQIEDAMAQAEDPLDKQPKSNLQ